MGAAIIGTVAAGCFETIGAAITTMGGRGVGTSQNEILHPNESMRAFFQTIRARYDDLAEFELRRIGEDVTT